MKLKSYPYNPIPKDEERVSAALEAIESSISICSDSGVRERLRDQRDELLAEQRALEIYEPIIESNVSNGYSPYWNLVSKSLREDHYWCCEKCGVNLRSFPHLLHVHHINRNRMNNSYKNLKVLCLLCHAEERGHKHLLAKVSDEEIQIVQAARDGKLDIADSYYATYLRKSRKEFDDDMLF